MFGFRIFRRRLHTKQMILQVLGPGAPAIWTLNICHDALKTATVGALLKKE